MPPLFAWVGAIVVVCLIVWAQSGIYSYRIENGAIEIILFHVAPIYRIPILDIVAIRKASWSELGVGGRTLRLGNRVVGQCVLLEKRGGWLRRIVITPADADNFIARVKAEDQR